MNPDELRFDFERYYNQLEDLDLDYKNSYINDPYDKESVMKKAREWADGLKGYFNQPRTGIVTSKTAQEYDRELERRREEKRILDAQKKMANEPMRKQEQIEKLDRLREEIRQAQAAIERFNSPAITATQNPNPITFEQTFGKTIRVDVLKNRAGTSNASITFDMEAAATPPTPVEPTLPKPKVRKLYLDEE